MRKVTRRTWLGCAGTAALTLSVPQILAGETSKLRTAAKKNIKLAIFTGVYSGLPVAQAAERIRDEGFSGVVLEYNFADVRFDPWAPNWSAVEKITEAFGRYNLAIVGLFGYYNVVDPDETRRRRGEQRMQLLINNWRLFKCRVVCTETGTLNAQSEWLESPDNATEVAYVQCRENFEKLAHLAEKAGAVVAIEPYWRNVIDSAPRAQRLFRDIGSPALKLVMDPCNYFRKEDLPSQNTMLRDIFARLGKYVVLAHAKDVRPSADGTDLPAAGMGVLNYPLYLRLLVGLKKEVYLAVEHLTLNDVKRVRDYVQQQIDSL
ncbi:MAG: sugar phosphate isomerase/epimerase [Verrucomicrobiae bacterium]|nr:sugar phosphate isomerase/epimerase [Verrucomicrobiae bacterium]